jgi:hypothetical protein
MGSVDGHGRCKKAFEPKQVHSIGANIRLETRSQSWDCTRVMYLFAALTSFKLHPLHHSHEVTQ